jgi:hypothetical protein
LERPIHHGKRHLKGAFYGDGANPQQGQLPKHHDIKKMTRKGLGLGMHPIPLFSLIVASNRHLPRQKYSWEHRQLVLLSAMLQANTKFCTGSFLVNFLPSSHWTLMVPSWLSILTTHGYHLGRFVPNRPIPRQPTKLAALVTVDFVATDVIVHCSFFFLFILYSHSEMRILAFSKGSPLPWLDRPSALTAKEESRHQPLCDSPPSPVLLSDSSNMQRRFFLHGIITDSPVILQLISGKNESNLVDRSIGTLGGKHFQDSHRMGIGG